ncbi:hypothetical protein PPL_01477 [Heterostelium album PN500]|uniref:Transmembrane protein n=1 Tax=Heterostelium pallidum (strain ATCC 26659 / Pp 5 / PN500) TaxID=670386 RepID=D3AZD7_HETP5|nr:hypothetical protein PPL_01477 [Heterostelium album PN500]EFA85520.1 hypothetical protein PPL_01477 [Heterostelium album PN500]|eukprot:XP_020437628.1 hypothetical protein PPL_01477 [Heterostelium album PN500]
MNKLLQVIALFVIAAVAANAQTYVAFQGYSMTQVFLSNYCQRPSSGDNYAYLILDAWTVQYNTYSDYYCQNVFTSQKLTVGMQPNSYVQMYLANSINFSADGFYYNVIYANGTNCNGAVAYAYSQPINYCVPLNYMNPNAQYQTIQCTPTGYIQYIYNGYGCTGPYTSQQYVTSTSCTPAGPGYFNTCVNN